MTNQINIKQWFTQIIMPDFNTKEAKVRLGSFVESPGEYQPSPRLQGVTRDMRRLSTEVNYDYFSLPDGATEESKSCIQRWFKSLGAGGMRSTTIALTASALGSGCLALPYAFSQVGIGLGLVTLFAAGIVSALSLQILMVAARYTGCGTYAELMELAMGTQVTSYILDIILLLNGLGSVICCLIFQGDFVPAIVAKFPWGGGFDLARNTAVIGAAIAVWPLAIPDDISALRYVGIAVPIALMVVTMVVVLDAPGMHAQAVERGYELEWWNFENPLGWLKATAIFMNAYTNQMNGVQCADNFVNPSVNRIVKCTLNSTLLVSVLYATMGVAGYVSYMSATKGDFLLNYPVGRSELWIIRSMLSVIVYVALPVSLLPAAKSAAQLLFRVMGKGNVRVGPVTHAISATLFLGVCLCCALRTSDVATVLNIVGGILATPIMFFFPAIAFYQLLWPLQPRVFRGPVLISMLIFGFLGLASVFLNEIWFKYVVHEQ